MSKPANILIVDDSEPNRFILKEMVDELGYTSILAENGVAALKHIQKHIDMVLLDIMMPEMDGYEFLDRIKEDNDLRHIPVVVISSIDEIDSVIRCIQKGADDYLHKPFNPILLKARISACLEKKRLRDAERALNQALEDRVEQRTSKIKQLLRQKDAFINQLSHDLKTPLTPLVALLPMVVSRINDKKTKRMLGLIMENVDYMKNLTEKTLQLARLNAPSVQMNVEKVDLINEIGNIVSSLSPVFEEHGIKVVNNTVPPLVIEADRMLIKELFHNLVSNAVKFSKRDGVVTFDCIYNGDNVEVSIKDNGVGMTEDQLKQVFNEFYKVDDSRHDRSSTGLGLTICQRIVEMHGGSIWAESPGPGHGATVHFTLPSIQDECNE